MTEHGISHDLNDRSLFDMKQKQYQWDNPQVIGMSKINHIKKKWDAHEKFYTNYDKILDGIREILGK